MRELTFALYNPFMKTREYQGGPSSLYVHQNCTDHVTLHSWENIEFLLGCVQLQSFLYSHTKSTPRGYVYCRDKPDYQLFLQDLWFTVSGKCVLYGRT